MSFYFSMALMLGNLIAVHDEPISMEAGKAMYQGQTVKMEDQIMLEIGEGKKLACQSADFDPQSGVLLLHGSADEKIAYRDKDVTLRCNHARLETNSDFHLQRLETFSDVEIVYAGEITAKGDNADYQSGDDGYFQLSGHQSCQLENSKGDKIQAKQIIFHPADSDIVVEHPTGTLATKPFATHFEADRLIWNRDTGDFKFIGNVKIRQNKLGAIAVSDVLIMNKDKRDLHAEGEIEVSFLLSNTLKCKGTLDIDHSKHIATVHSPVEPIIFKDARGQIQAHRATVHYLGDDKPLFLRFIAEEDVRIISFATVDDVISESTMHTILTDHAELNAGTQSLSLKADEGKRTLLYDHVNHLQVSAPSLNMKRDSVTNKDKIEGLGDVRFSFTEQELERIKQQLSWIK